MSSTLLRRCKDSGLKRRCLQLSCDDARVRSWRGDVISIVAAILGLGVENERAL
jgi:hypothetical protein